MTLRVRLARPARRFLIAESLYLTERNPLAALEFRSRIRDARLRLAEFPDSGAAGRVAGTRRLIVGLYILTYRYTSDGIEIVTIRHGRQADPDAVAIEVERTPSPIADKT